MIDKKWFSKCRETRIYLLKLLDSHFEFDASYFTSLDLTSASHTCDLKPRDETIVRIDFKKGGIGTGSCGPYTFEKYLLNDKKIQYAFSIIPFSREDIPPSELVKF